jgi:hypothetical protein
MSNETDKTQWYVALYVARITVDDDNDEPESADREYAGSAIVVRAQTDEEAASKARTQAIAADDTYKNEAGEEVKWSFADLLDVRPVLGPRIEDGTEIYSWFMSAEAYAEVKDQIRIQSRS